MKTLNLTDLNKSDIKYKISRFPDGQQNIVIDNKIPIYDNSNINEWLIIPVRMTVTIKSRLNNFLDLELIICAVASLRELGIKEIHLYTPYFLGSRSDRKFEEGSNNYLKDVICPIINSLKFSSVTVLDPHSHVLEACIKGFRKEDNTRLVTYYLGQIFKSLDLNQFILVSPDAGASHKIYKLAKQIGYKGDIITCSKYRDENGKLDKTIVPLTKTTLGKDMIIIDDICDGGATFINIAKEIKKQFGDLYTGKIYLIVTHGIFSKGLEELAKYFDGIYCTNSYSDLPYVYITDDTTTIKNKQKVKQLNVF